MGLRGSMDLLFVRVVCESGMAIRTLLPSRHEALCACRQAKSQGKGKKKSEGLHHDMSVHVQYALKRFRFKGGLLLMDILEDFDLLLQDICVIGLYVMYFVNCFMSKHENVGSCSTSLTKKCDVSSAAASSTK